jgi:hypothetical protein
VIVLVFVVLGEVKAARSGDGDHREAIVVKVVGIVRDPFVAVETVNILRR